MRSDKMPVRYVGYHHMIMYQGQLNLSTATGGMVQFSQ